MFIVPLFISEGYFSGEVIPRELDFASITLAQRSTLTLHIFYCRPVGTHDSMTRVLLARAREIVEQFPFPRAPQPKDITLFIAGHGTEKNANSRKAIERQAELIRAMNLYAGVHAIFWRNRRALPIATSLRGRKTWWSCRFSSATVCTRRKTFR